MRASNNAGYPSFEGQGDFARMEKQMATTIILGFRV